MNRRTLGLVAVILVCVVTLFMTVAKQKGLRSGSAHSDSVYNPYPPGIIPSDLMHEVAREMSHKAERRTATTKTVRETEAEAIAFVVGKTIGLETGRASADSR